MAIDLSNAQRQALVAAGLTPNEIRAFQLGTADTQLRIKAINAIKSGNSNQGFPVSPHGGAGVTPSGGVPQRTPTPSSSGTTGYPVNPNSPTLANPPSTGYGGRGVVDPMRDPVPKPAPAGLPTVPTGTGMNPYTPFQYDPGENPYGMPNAPGQYPFQIPNIEMRDFTEQAKKIAAEAFAPYLAAFDIARTRAESQGKTSKEATAGLYANFTKDIAAKAAETAERYGDIKAEQATRGEAQQADIQENTQSANANISDQLNALGLQTSIPTALEQGAAEQVNAQNDAAAATESQQQFMDTQQVAQGDYDTQYGNIMQHQGIVAQGDLESQLMNILAGIDVSKANASGEQSQTALQLAQQLADRDFQMQTQNAGLSMQGQQLEAGQQQTQFENLRDLHTGWEGENQVNFKNAFDLWAAEQGFNIDSAAAAGKAGPGEFDMGDYPGQARSYGILLNMLGDEEAANEVYTSFGDILGTFYNTPEYINNKDSPQKVRQYFAEYASDVISKKTGIPPAKVAVAAMEYFSNSES